MTPVVDSVEALVQHIESLLAEQADGQRLIIGVAGAPGAGKSTLAEEVCHCLNRIDAEVTVSRAERAVVVPMDGFHLDNVLLREREQMAVKGAPQTYDIDGFVALVHRLSVSDERSIYIPVFDRAADLSRNAVQCVTGSHNVIIVEGNYLLLQRPGWAKLAPLFNLSIMLDVPIEVLEARLVQRWLDYGLDADAARQRALSNDIPNARLVLEESSGAHLRFKSVRQ